MDGVSAVVCTAWTSRSLTGELYCIDTLTGDTIWNKRIENSPSYWGVASSPLVYENMVFLTTFSGNASNNGTLHAFNFDGNELWNISVGDTFYNPLSKAPTF
ncbi:MAG: outer membrane protein assembly factor BamB family protein [Candidatus Syntropharchaeia archaeon]